MKINRENEAKLDLERLHAFLRYDAETGQFTWKKQKGAEAKVGRIAGAIRPTGYIQIKMDRIQYLAHRLAWVYTFGEWPREELDHINLNKSDNRILNLRQATTSQNIANRPMAIDNKAGLKGVVWHKRDKRWQAQITSNRKQIHLGNFGTREAAHRAYCRAAKRFHGEFARTK